MNLWIFCHYAGPHWGLTRSYDLGKHLTARGHHVTIFASSFSHYSLHDEQLQPGEWYREQNYDGVRFVWVRTCPYSGNDWRRYLNTVTYAWRATRSAIQLAESPDVIVGSSAHLLAPLAAWFVARLRRARFVFELRDLWPQVLIDMGKLRPQSLVAHLLYKLEAFLYRRADVIVSLMPDVRDYMSSCGVSERKVVWIPNGVDVTRFDIEATVTLTADRPFTVMYVGGIQEYNGLGSFIEAAKLMQDRGDPPVRFVIVGAGTDKERLVGLAVRLDLANVEFRDWLPKREVFGVLRTADVLFHSARDLPVYFRYGVSPVKISEYLLSGRPILYAAKGSNDPVTEAGAGLTVRPDDPAAIVDGIQRLMAMSVAEREAMGRHGREYARRCLDIAVLAEQYEESLLATLAVQPHQTIVADRNRVVPTVSARPSNARPGYRRVKRFFDIILSSILIALFCVPMLVLWVIIRVSLNGPALYVSDRVGANNVIFKMYKFRTMSLETAPVATHLLKESEMVMTPLGHWLRVTSLDEIPQLLNIFKGDMSFVGPRPALFNQHDLVMLRTQAHLHTLTPGLTGWAQINGRDKMSIPAKVQYDDYYRRHASMLFDLWILAATTLKVLRREDVNH